MCGIAGAISLDRKPVGRLGSVLGAMNGLIAHRGPDGQGVWQSDNHECGLAHRRLAIIDLSAAGKQPMIGPNGHVLTFNGEIYNYLELMQELYGSWTFKSRSDSEALLAAYDKWGVDCLQRLRGMFAFA